MKIVTSLLTLFIISFCFEVIHAQQTGRAPDILVNDTNIVFISPRPLLEDSLVTIPAKYIIGMNIFISGNGYGGGAFYQRIISKSMLLFADLGISGARNTDEQELYDPYSNSYLVPEKINRLYLLPLMFGVQYRVLSDVFTDSFRPFVGIGIGPACIIATPYKREFFSSFGYSTLYVKPGGFIGIGANIGGFGRNVSGISMRYYIIPFGNGGLESIRNLPITDFGGIFLALNIGWAY